MPTLEEKKNSADQLKLLGGTKDLVGTDAHVALSVSISSDEGRLKSTLVITDAAKAVSDKNPVFITKPIKIKLEKLAEVLGDKIPRNLKDFMDAASVSCEAFYYSGSEGPMLMIFDLNFGEKPANFPALENDYKDKEKKAKDLRLAAKTDPTQEAIAAADKAEAEANAAALKLKTPTGLIGSLSGCPELGEMFDIENVSVRVFRCDKDHYQKLQEYCEGLSS